MLQLLYIGHNTGAKIWQHRTAMHASRLGLCSNIIQWVINPERQVLIASIEYDRSLNHQTLSKTDSFYHGVLVKQRNNRWELKRLENRTDYYKTIDTREMGDIWITISQDGCDLYLWCGIIAIDHLYYYRATDVLVISNDLRLFVSGDTNDLDPHGFHSLFHFGALSAPLTVFKNVKRVPPGYLLKFSCPDFIEELTPHFLQDFRAHSSATLPSDAALEKSLIAEINQVPTDSGLFFSGGVDSGLLAALAKRCGRFDLHLINCDFTASLGAGITDSEAELARDMATHLGYKLDVFSFDISSVARVLERIGDDYPFPFSDYSVIAQNQLVHYAQACLKPGRWVIDGTGADGIFLNGYLWDRMAKLYRIPRVIRKFMALLYQYVGILSGGGLLSELLGTVSESLKVPLMQLIILSTNKLSGYAFLDGRGVLDNVLQTQKTYIETLLNPFDHRLQLSLLDLHWVCAGIFAAKGFNPLRSRGLQPFFPFLSEKVIGVGAAIMNDEQGLPENKRVLKALLLRDVPYEMIYRRKSGFRPPLTVILRYPEVREYINESVLARDNPVNEFVYYPVVTQLFKRIWNNKPIGRHHLSFIWAYIFSSIWLKQQFDSYCEPPERID